MGSVMTNKYAEGYPGKRYYGGCQIVDQSETIAIERAKELYGVFDFGYPAIKIPSGYKIKIPNTETATELVTKYPEKFKDYEITKGKMDDVFLAVTGYELED